LYFFFIIFNLFGCRGFQSAISFQRIARLTIGQGIRCTHKKRPTSQVSLFLNNILDSNKTVTAYLSIGIYRDGRYVIVRISFSKIFMLQ
jgi:hypothetical protein